MPYTDFTLDQFLDRFGLTVGQAPLFSDLTPHPGTRWLHEALAMGLPIARYSEKSRFEFIVAPVLMTVRKLSGDRVTVFSGQRFDIDPAAGLAGECDFLIAATEPLPVVRAPLIGVVEAKKNDIESGLGQCAAQLLAVLRFNQRRRESHPDETFIADHVYGCVTTGDVWQFLRLTGDTLTLDTNRFYLREIGLILSAFLAILSDYLPPSTDATGGAAAAG